MSPLVRALAAAFALLPAQGALAQAADAPRHAAGLDFHYSSDADGTEVARTALNLDLDYRDAGDYRGISVEKAWFDPLGQGRQGRERVYLRLADRTGAWAWNARVGTDGGTVLGAASVHNDAPVRQEYFIERDIVDTPQGLARGIYHSFAGAALDLPVNDRNVFTVMAGLQEFTGDNVRTHLRANFVHVVKPEWGLSAQLRTRYFRSSAPGEFDYYSPRWYAQALPVLQVRRHSRGWRYVVAAGVGLQRDSATDWRRASYFEARVSSPPAHNWRVEAAMLYSETPATSGLSYDYRQFTLGLTRAF